MAAWKYACKTIQGMNLDLKLVGRENLPLKLTRAVSGSGYGSPTQLMGLTDISSPVQELQLMDAVEHIDQNTVMIPIVLRNSNVKEKYDMHQMGIYAEDPDLGEILYIVLQSEGAEEIPSGSEMKDFKLEWYINMSVSNADNIEIVIDETGILTVEQGDARYVTINHYEDTTDKLAQKITEESERASGAEGDLQRRKLDVDGNASDVTVEFSEAEDLVLLNGLQKLSELFGASAKAVSSLIAHLEDKNNPHEVSREQMQVDKVDNTSDMEKPVSTAQQTALDALHAQLTAYADKAIADLINGAPSTLDTLGEIAAAMEENADVVSALNEAVGRKANAAEFDSHAKDAVKHITAAERESWNNKLPAAGGTVSGSLTVAGLISAGGKARMWTDSEGGNFGFSAPDGTQWEIDAVDGNLRIFTYASSRGITINKLGEVSFPYGAHGILYGGLHGSMVAEGGVGGRGIHANANEFGIDLPPEEGYAGGLTWYQGSTAVGCVGYYKQGGYYYIGTDYENPDGELCTGHIHVKYGYGIFTRHIEGANGDTLFLNYNHPLSSVVVGDTSNRVGGYGFLYAGARAAIWTDGEGGNVRIMSPNDVEYQMDAFNDDLRLYRHVGDDYRSAFTVDGTGILNCPCGVMTNNIQGPNSGANGFVLINPSYVHDDFKIRIGAYGIGGNMWITTVCSEKDNEYNLGTPSKRWSQVYAVNSAISTSDETMKRNITPLDGNTTKNFIMGLNPISYIRTDGESGRTHYGMGAQSVELLMEELGMTSMDFAGLIKSPMHEDYEVEEEVEVEKLVPNENGKPIPRKVREIQKVTKQREIPGRYRYGLRYEEFIAPLIKVVQMQQEEIEELKKSRDGMMRRLEKIEKAFGV